MGAEGAEEGKSVLKLYFHEKGERSIESFEKLLDEAGLSYENEKIPEQDWNRRWEERFEPVLIGKELVVRAPFHPPFQERPYRIEILPERAFGTGHHATTRLMLQKLLELPLKGCRVLDMGCGTGILSILCEQRGAEHVEAFDNDQWAVHNCQETLRRNGCRRIEVEHREKLPWKGTGFDVILGNIQREALLRLIPSAAELLEPGAHLLLSGLRSKDVPKIDDKCRAYDLDMNEQKEEEGWVMLAYQRRS